MYHLCILYVSFWCVCVCVCVCARAQVFREARRSIPSVVYMPHVSEWWEAVSDTVRSTFITLLQDIPSLSPILILATADCPYTQLPEEVRHSVSVRGCARFNETASERETVCVGGVHASTRCHTREIGAC